jgi:hypothetical protein
LFQYTRNWDESLTIFQLAPQSINQQQQRFVTCQKDVWERDVLPCGLMFWVPLNKDQSTADYVVDLVDKLHDYHHYTYQHLKRSVIGRRPAMTALSTSARFQKWDKLWLYCLI